MPELHFIDGDGELLDVVPYCSEECLNMDLEETSARGVAHGTNVPAEPPLDGVLDPRGVFVGFFEVEQLELVNYVINWMRGTDQDDAECHRCGRPVPRRVILPPVPVATKKHHVFGHQVVERAVKPFAGERLRRLEFEDEVAEAVLVQEAYGICEGYRVLLELDLDELQRVISVFEHMFGGPVPEEGIIAGGIYDKLFRARQALEAKLAGG